MGGPIYHSLIRCSVTMTYGRVHDEIKMVKKYARSCNIPFILLKTRRPGLIYVESRDKAALAEWVRRTVALRSCLFQCVVPPSRAPVREDRPAKAYGERLVEVANTTAFGEELARRGLIDWWFQNEAFKDAKGTGRI